MQLVKSRLRLLLLNILLYIWQQQSTAATFATAAMSTANAAVMAKASGAETVKKGAVVVAEES